MRHTVREIESAEKDIRDETEAMISNTGRYSLGNVESAGDKLNTFNENIL